MRRQPTRGDRVQGTTRGIPLEPMPADGIDPLAEAERQGRRPTQGAQGGNGARDLNSEDAPPRGFFERFTGRQPQSPRRQAGPAGGSRDGVISVEPRTDPAADAELKRRIEKQLRSAGGDRLRSMDVKVAGKKVVIKARANHFWQRRGLRRSIETIPALSGLKSQVDVE